MFNSLKLRKRFLSSIKGVALGAYDQKGIDFLRKQIKYYLLLILIMQLSLKLPAFSQRDKSDLATAIFQ